MENLKEETTNGMPTFTQSAPYAQHVQQTQNQDIWAKASVLQGCPTKKFYLK